MLSTFARPEVFPLEPISLLFCAHRDGKPSRSMVIWKAFSNRPRYLVGSEKVGRFYVCNTHILTYFASVISVVQKKATSKCAVNCNIAGYINPERLSFFSFCPSICFYAAVFLSFKTFYRIKCKSSVSKFIHIFEHSDSDYTFLVMFPGCRTSNLTAGVTGHSYFGEALWPMQKKKNTKIVYNVQAKKKKKKITNVNSI